MTLDPYSGKILADDSPRNASLAERVLTATAALHTGSLFGFPGRAVMALASLLVMLQAWSGAMMLWKRRFAHEGISR
jgi:sulfite reductase (NADPH) flavoprotein alpha-component